MLSEESQCQQGSGRWDTRGTTGHGYNPPKRVPRFEWACPRATRTGVLRGSYVLFISKPIEGLNRLEGDLRRRLVEYIANTQADSSAPEETILKQGRQHITIRKYGEEKNQVAMGGPVVGRWEGEAAAELCTLLQEVLKQKAHKLRHITRPWILLICDSYLFAEPKMFSDCLPLLQSVADFHTIFLVSERNGVVLHTQEPSWRKTDWRNEQRSRASQG
jgi:hypothetical protein